MLGLFKVNGESVILNDRVWESPKVSIVPRLRCMSERIKDPKPLVTF